MAGGITVENVLWQTLETSVAQVCPVQICMNRLVVETRGRNTTDKRRDTLNM
jgi:hypothetical protein